MISTTPATSVRRRKSPKRAVVIEAATEEFLARGFAGTSMDRIAAAAGVSKRTVYDHFPSKDILFQSIVDEILLRVDQMPSIEYSSEAPLEEQLFTIGTTFTETITSRDFMKLSKVLTATFIRAPEWAHNTTKAYARLRRDMVAFFTTGTKEGRLAISDPELAAAQFCGLIKEVVFWPEIMAGQGSATSHERREAVKDAVAIFLSYYSDPEAEARWRP